MGVGVEVGVGWGSGLLKMVVCGGGVVVWRGVRGRGDIMIVGEG